MYSLDVFFAEYIILVFNDIKVLGISENRFEFYSIMRKMRPEVAGSEKRSCKIVVFGK